MDLIKKLFKGDKVVWIIFMFLCVISLIEVYSATSTLAYRKDVFWEPILRHATFLLAGVAAMLVLHHIPNRYFSIGVIFLPLSIIMLIITPFIGSKINMAHRFLSVFGFQFQPSEIAKISCVIFIAYFLSKQERNRNAAFWIMIIALGITCALIFPENFSTAFLLFVVCFIMMFIGRADSKKMLLTVVILVVAGGGLFAVFKLTPDGFAKKYFPDRAITWKHRLEGHIAEEDENKYVINDENRQVNHSKIAIARGGFIGRLPGRSIQRDYLPQAYSDFIYAIIIEEMGLIGGIGVLALYIILLFRVAIIARRCKRLFPKYLALGSGLLVVIQALINMAVAVNLIPVTGQPLPLISRGGTSVILNCLYFGIILSVSRFSAGMGEENDESDEEVEQAESDEEVEQVESGRQE